MNRKHCHHLSLLMLCMMGICMLSVFAAEPVDITLADSIQMALKNNHTVKESLYDVETAQWKLAEASRSKGPIISWSSIAKLAALICSATITPVPTLGCSASLPIGISLIMASCAPK